MPPPKKKRTASQTAEGMCEVGQYVVQRLGAWRKATESRISNSEQPDPGDQIVLEIIDRFFRGGALHEDIGASELDLAKSKLERQLDRHAEGSENFWVD